MGLYSDDQRALEQKMAELGVQRHRTKVDKARAKKRESTTAAGRYLLREAVEKLVVALEEWVKNAKSGAGRRHGALEYLDQLDLKVAAFITVRCALDSISLSKTLLAAGSAVGSVLEDEVRFAFMHKNAKSVWDKLKKQTKASSYKHRRKVFRGAIGRLEVEFPTWPRQQRLRVGVTLLELLRQSTGLIEIATRRGPRGRVIQTVTASPATLKWLEQSNEAHEALSPVYMPCVDQPADWDDIYSGGYHTNLLTRRPLVRSLDRAYLIELQHSEMPEVLDAVNTLQRVVWEVNRDVYEVLTHLWQSGIAAADMPSRDDEMLPTRPSDLETNPEARKAWRRAAAEIYKRNVAVRSRRVQTAKIVYMAEQFRDQQFFFPYQVDFRGRLYCVPFFLQPQGQSQARGLLRFADGKPITNSTQADWLAIHGANCWGFDKVSMAARIDWVRANTDMIRAIHQDPTDCMRWVEADKPWEFLAFALEWGAYLEQGFGFVSKLPVAMDGSNNGLQIFSLLLRDPSGAAATNCSPGDAPRDIYQDVADKVTAKLLASSNPFAAGLLEFCQGRVPRACAKRPVMTLPYGSTRYSCQKYVTEWYEEIARTRGNPFPTTYYQACGYLAQLVWDSIGETVVSARSCMSWLQSVAELCYDLKLPVRWHAPSGFPIKQGYTKYDTLEIRTTVGDTVRWGKYRQNRDELHKRHQLNGISPNFIHSLDAAALVRTVNLAREQGITSFAMVHDSFGVLAADADVMARSLRSVYAEMFSVDLLEKFRAEIQLHVGDRGTVPTVPPMGTFDVNSVRESVYFFA